MMGVKNLRYCDRMMGVKNLRYSDRMMGVKNLQYCDRMVERMTPVLRQNDGVLKASRIVTRGGKEGFGIITEW